MKDNKDCSVIVIARDVTIDLVRLTIEFWKRFWPVSKFNRFLCIESDLSEEYKFFEKEFDQIFITHNKDYNYLQRVEFALERVQTKYVVLLLEDFFLTDNFSDESIDKLIEFAAKSNAGSIQLQRLRRFSKKYDKYFNIIAPNSLYRIVTSPSLFKYEYIIKFMELKCTPWQFERKATKFSKKFSELCFCTRQSIYPAVHACSEQKWFSGAVRLFRKCSIPEDLWKRRNKYPLLKEFWILLKWYIICLFPRTINRIQEIRSEHNEKKVITC